MIAKRTFPDIIHLVGTNALVFAPVSKLLGASSKIVRHIFTSYDRSDLAIRPVRWLANTVFIDSYAFTTPRIGPWADERSFRTRRFLVRPPINCDLYRPIPKKDSNPMARSGETILYMGPLWGSRFPAVRVLKAIRLLSRKGTDPHLLVLTSATRTSPMESERLISLARNAGLENRITVQRVDLSEEQRVMAYNRADVVIFPYTGPIPERLADPPFGILEAMSCGRPILATDVLSISEVVKDGDTGLVAIDSTPENIADGLYRALKNSDRAKIERNARQCIMEDFSYPVVRERLLASYTSLVK